MKSFGIYFLLLQLQLLLVFTTNAFNDTQGHVFEKEINYIKNNNIVNGFSDGSFRPDKYVNRAEFTKILILSSPYSSQNSEDEKNCFIDVKNEWFAKYICKAKFYNIANGYSNNYFKPDYLINFAELSKIIVKLFNIPNVSGEKWYSGYIESLQKTGISPSSLKSPNQFITRGEMGYIIYQLKATSKGKCPIPTPPPLLENCSLKNVNKSWKNGCLKYDYEIECDN